MWDRKNWQQEKFSHWEVNGDDFWETMSRQRDALKELQASMEESDPIVTSALVAELDLDVLRYACLELHKSLIDAVRNDAAELLSMSIMPNIGLEASQSKWEKWIACGEVWRTLLLSEWRQIKEMAVAKVCAQMQKDGAALDKRVMRELERGIHALDLPDVLEPEIYARFFPDQLADSGFSGGEF